MLKVKHFITSRSQQFTSLRINLMHTSAFRVQQLRPVTPGTPNLKLSVLPLRLKLEPGPLLKTNSLTSLVMVGVMSVCVPTPDKLAELMLAHVCGLFLHKRQLSLPVLGTIRNSSISILTSVSGNEAESVKLPAIVDTGFGVEILFWVITCGSFKLDTVTLPLQLHTGGQLITNAMRMGGHCVLPQVGVMLSQ